MNTISDRIATRLNELGLKQVDLVEATGLSKGAVSKWVTGTSAPSSEHISTIAKTLKVSPDWLLTGQGNYQNSHQINNVEGSIHGSFNQSVSHHYAGEDLVNLDFYPEANLTAPKQVLCLTRQTLPTNATFATVAIDSLMQPVIRQKSLVAVSKLQEGDLIYPNKIYVLNMGGLLICRYLERLTGSRMRVYSEYDKTGVTLTQDEFTQEYQIMGSVVWLSSFME